MWTLGVALATLAVGVGAILFQYYRHGSEALPTIVSTENSVSESVQKTSEPEIGCPLEPCAPSPIVPYDDSPASQSDSR